MIDHLDKQTQQLPLEPKRGRGRPATGQALSNAERQRLYRERQKAQRNEKANSEDVERLTKNFRQVHGQMERLRVQAVEKDLKIAQLERQIEQLKAELTKKTQLAQRNEKPSRLNEGMQKIIRDVHEIADAIEGSTWRIQRKARANGRWATLKGSYWNEAQAEDALADLPNKKGAWWRIVEVKSKVED